MAAEQVTLVVVEMEAGTLAVAPHLARGALVLPGPAAVAHHLETVLPHIPEIVLVDVALVHVAAHGGAAADGAVATDARHVDPAAAVEEMVAHLLLVLAEETLAGVAYCK